MKKLALVIFLNFTTILIHAQEKSYDTLPYALDYHNERINLFKKEVTMKGKIVFLGNSIIEFGDWKGLLNDSTVINRGIAGDNTFGVLDRLDEVIALEPYKLFIIIGINDLSKNIPEEVVVRNIFYIVERVKAESPRSRIFVHSILPTNGIVKNEFPDAFNKNDRAIKVNDQLKKHAKRIGFTFIDLYNKFLNGKSELDIQYTTDGLHLNDEGYQLWIRILNEGKYIGAKM